MELLKQAGTILLASILIGLSMIFLGVGSPDVDELVPRSPAYRFPTCESGVQRGPSIGDAIKISGC
jgi:hypothetical protein